MSDIRLSLPADYTDWLNSLKQRIRSARQRAMLAANDEQIRDFSTIAGDYRSLARWSTFIVSARGGPWISRNMSRAIRPRIVA